MFFTDIRTDIHKYSIVAAFSCRPGIVSVSKLYKYWLDTRSDQECHRLRTWIFILFWGRDIGSKPQRWLRGSKKERASNYQHYYKKTVSQGQCRSRAGVYKWGKQHTPTHLFHCFLLIHVTGTSPLTQNEEFIWLTVFLLVVHF